MVLSPDACETVILTSLRLGTFGFFLQSDDSPGMSLLYTRFPFGIETGWLAVNVHLSGFCLPPDSIILPFTNCFLLVPWPWQRLVRCLLPQRSKQLVLSTNGMPAWLAFCPVINVVMVIPCPLLFCALRMTVLICCQRMGVTTLPWHPP